MANAAARELRPVLAGLLAWKERILKCTYSTQVDFKIVDEGIQVDVAWVHKGTPGSWSRVLTNAEVLSHTPGSTPSVWVGNRRACTFARIVIRDVLTQRGV